jgi:hypothetical protein
MQIKPYVSDRIENNNFSQIIQKYSDIKEVTYRITFQCKNPKALSAHI